jgi:hypothetical protein
MVSRFSLAQASMDALAGAAPKPWRGSPPSSAGFAWRAVARLAPIRSVPTVTRTVSPLDPSRQAWLQAGRFIWHEVGVEAVKLGILSTTLKP